MVNVGGAGKNAYLSLIPGGNSGFYALLGGDRIQNGNFLGIDTDSYFWSNSPNDEETAWYMNLYIKSNDVFIHQFNRQCGFSVRCILNKKELE